MPKKERKRQDLSKLEPTENGEELQFKRNE